MAGSITFKMSYGKNTGSIVSPAELLNLYFYGIPLTCSTDGRIFSRKNIATQIKIAQQKIEHTLQIKLIKQTFEESMDFAREEFVSWGFMKATYPINEVLELNGYLNNQLQLTYPKEWLTTKKTSDEKEVTRSIHLVPNGGASPNLSNIAIVYVGLSPQIGLFGNSRVPEYWKVKYCTGFTTVPMDLFDAVCKLAAIPLLAQLGDVTLGIGFSSQSLSVDGLSQSLSLNKNSEGGLYNGRIKSYMNDLVADLQNLKDYYRGFQFNVL